MPNLTNNQYDYMYPDVKSQTTLPVCDIFGMEEMFDNNRKWRPGSNTGQDYNTTEQRIWCQNDNLSKDG